MTRTIQLSVMLMKYNLIFVIILACSSPATAQNHYMDPIQEIYNDVLDMYSSSEKDYKSRINHYGI